MKRFAGLSLIPAPQFVVRVSLLFAFHRRRSRSCSYHHHAHECGITILFGWSLGMRLAWRGSVGTCNIHVYSVSREWNRHSRSVDARVPVDHASVGLAQARPNETQCTSVKYK